MTTPLGRLPGRDPTPTEQTVSRGPSAARHRRTRCHTTEIMAELPQGPVQPGSNVVHHCADPHAGEPPLKAPSGTAPVPGWSRAGVRPRSSGHGQRPPGPVDHVLPVRFRQSLPSKACSSRSKSKAPGQPDSTTAISIRPEWKSWWSGCRRFLKIGSGDVDTEMSIWLSAAAVQRHSRRASFGSARRRGRTRREARESMSRSLALALLCTSSGSTPKRSPSSAAT